MFDASAGAGLVWFNPKQQKRVSDPPIGDFSCGRNNVVAISILYIYSEIFGEHETKSQLAGETSDKQRELGSRHVPVVRRNAGHVTSAERAHISGAKMSSSFVRFSRSSPPQRTSPTEEQTHLPFSTCRQSISRRHQRHLFTIAILIYHLFSSRRVYPLLIVSSSPSPAAASTRV